MLARKTAYLLALSMQYVKLLIIIIRLLIIYLTMSVIVVTIANFDLLTFMQPTIVRSFVSFVRCPRHSPQVIVDCLREMPLETLLTQQAFYLRARDVGTAMKIINQILKKNF